MYLAFLQITPPDAVKRACCHVKRGNSESETQKQNGNHPFLMRKIVAAFLQTGTNLVSQAGCPLFNSFHGFGFGIIGQ